MIRMYARICLVMPVYLIWVSLESLQNGGVLLHNILAHLDDIGRATYTHLRVGPIA